MLKGSPSRTKEEFIAQLQPDQAKDFEEWLTLRGLTDADISTIYTAVYWEFKDQYPKDAMEYIGSEYFPEDKG